MAWAGRQPGPLHGPPGAGNQEGRQDTRHLRRPRGVLDLPQVTVRQRSAHFPPISIKGGGGSNQLRKFLLLFSIDVIPHQLES